MNKLILFFALVVLACKKPTAVDIPNNKIIIDKSENVGRSAWQKPNAVIEKLGDISKSTVADIGAGSGFFSFRLGSKANKVIAIDIDQEMIDLIELQKNNLPVDLQNKITTRLTNPNSPGLKTNEVNNAVIINTIAYIKPLEPYLDKLYTALRDSSTLMIVDFKPGSLSIPAPNENDRINAEILIKVLENSGFTVKEYDTNTLKYQYIILAKKIQL